MEAEVLGCREAAKQLQQQRSLAWDQLLLAHTVTEQLVQENETLRLALAHHRTDPEP